MNTCCSLATSPFPGFVSILEMWAWMWAPSLLLPPKWEKKLTVKIPFTAINLTPLNLSTSFMKSLHAPVVHSLPAHLSPTQESEKRITSFAEIAIPLIEAIDFILCIEPHNPAMQIQELAWPSIQSQLSSQFPSLAFTAMPVRPLIVRLIFMEFWVWADVTLRAWWNDLCNSCMESTWKGWISWCHLPWATNAPTSQVAPSKKQSKYMQEEMLPVMCTCSEAPNHSVTCTSSPSRHLSAALNRRCREPSLW